MWNWRTGRLGNGTGTGGDGQMYAMKCDRCGNYFDSNTLRIKSGELFVHINVRGEDNHCCKYDLCDDCVVEFFQWINDPGKLKR